MTRLEKVLAYTMMAVVFLTFGGIALDGLVGIFYILFDLEWNNWILHLFFNKWAIKAFIILILFFVIIGTLILIEPYFKRIKLKRKLRRLK